MCIRLRLLGDDGEQDARRAIGAAAVLLPGVKRRHVEPEGTRKRNLRKAKPPQLGYVHPRGHGHRVARQLNLAARMRERLIEAGDEA